MKLEKLKDVFEHVWCKETCYEPYQYKWTTQNAAFGQCYVTALIVHDYFGGEIYKVKSSNGINHYFNCVDGEKIDFTVSQFNDDETFSIPVLVEIENLDRNERYKLLKRKITSD